MLSISSVMRRRFGTRVPKAYLTDPSRSGLISVAEEKMLTAPSTSDPLAERMASISSLSVLSIIMEFSSPPVVPDGSRSSESRSSPFEAKNDDLSEGTLPLASLIMVYTASSIRSPSGGLPRMCRPSLTRASLTSVRYSCRPSKCSSNSSADVSGPRWRSFSSSAFLAASRISETMDILFPLPTDALALKYSCRALSTSVSSS